MAGIDVVVNKDKLRDNPHTTKGNIRCGAYLLKDYLVLYKTYPLALKRYKSWSPLGEKQANAVLRIANNA